ncbi:restriction endonuclease subunit S [Pseudidiomarina sp. 1APR75-33.1]|uniref:restriction endonuclease subunit S n=1 Tax=Pseudidiomarina terrestris TaxID=2820060 RepID=UPI0026509674|nr:restriction endonuclease subunit S [Pseudidiomarina sp. 1APR75-33.1]MDN7125913.1 restriction endonuclease subunit S [Pseudidiomarina sp. 1APR75-33.1]
MSRAELPRGWQWKTIGEVCRVIPGFAFKSKDWADSGIPVIKIKNIKSDCTIDVSNTDCVPPEVVSEKMGKFRLRKGDILIAMTGATAGKVGWLSSDREFLLNQRVAKLDPVDIEKRFFWGVISGRRYQDLFFHLADGAAQPNMSGKQIENVEIPVPPHQAQLHLASIVSTYDDLIENNTRRIEILEEMARRLYEEWFVHFRFPGHEEVSFKESELGEIPEKWEVRQLEEVVALNPRTKVPKEGEKWFVPMGALSESSMVVGSLEKKSGNSGAKFQNGDTLVARITPCLENGKTGFVDFLPEEQPTACGSTEFIVLRSISLCPEMVYLLARSDRFRDVAIKSMSGATGRQRVRVESLVELPVVQPDHATLEAFQRFVVPCFKQVRTLALKNANLRAQRDLLLPKLVSGEIDVSDITMPEDKEVEAA